MIRARKNIARAFLIGMLLMFLTAGLFSVYADAPQNPVTIQGVQYLLTAPESFSTTVNLAGEQLISLQNGQPTVISVPVTIPSNEISPYVRTFSNLGVTFTRSVSVTAVNTLTLLYSQEAYQRGEAFITGSLVQTVTTIESITSGGPFPTSTSQTMVQEVVHEVQSGNFAAITPENTLPLSFPLVSNGIISGTNLQQYYTANPLPEEYRQSISLGIEFIHEVFKNITPEQIAVAVPEVTPMVTLEPTIENEIEPIIDAVTEQFEQETSTMGNNLPRPAAAEVVAGAVSSAIIMGAMGAFTGAGSSGASSLASIFNVGAQTVVQASAASVAAGATSSVISFLRDVINGLRDMLMDEGRSHASGKVTQNLKKD